MCQSETIKTKRCSKYTFRLIGKPKNYYKGILVVDFKSSIKTKKITKNSILPTFNKDGKFYTPAFIIPSVTVENDEVLKQQHQRRKIENTQQISQIYIPKPRSRQKYCGVCRDYYEDYLQHINQQKHMEKLRNSTFQSYIIQQSIKFKNVMVEVENDQQKLTITQTSCQTIIPSNQEDLLQACLNFN